MYIYNKPSGVTINQFIELIKKRDNLGKICFCGRLDPMARGEIIILENEECKKMYDFTGKNKIYNFEIILGLKTTSDDPLGIIEEHNNNITDTIIERLYGILNKYQNMTFEQKFHNFSSKNVNGKPLWFYTKNNITVNVPKHTVSIFDIKVKNNKTYNFNSWKNKIINDIKSIDKSKDFNQEIIISQWQNMIIKQLISIPIEISVSSGFYVRQFVRDLSNELNFPLLTYDINRIKIII